MNKGRVTVASGAAGGHVGFLLAVPVAPHGIRCGYLNSEAIVRSAAGKTEPAY